MLAAAAAGVVFPTRDYIAVAVAAAVGATAAASLATGFRKMQQLSLQPCSFMPAKGNCRCLLLLLPLLLPSL